MDYLVIVVALAVTAFTSIGIIHLLSRAKKPYPASLPPGSFGLPLIGQTVGLLRAVRTNRGDGWIGDRINRYGPVSKLSLFFTPTVLLAGPAANKFMFFSSSLRIRQAPSLERLLGPTILALHGDDHRRVRGALMEFLKPVMLKLYVGRVDAEVRRHLEENWAGRTTVTVLPLAKQLTFNVIAALLFGLEVGTARDALADDFNAMLGGMMAIPLNLPFTAFSRSLKASRRARRLLEGIMRERKAKQAQGQGNNNDLISRLLTVTDDRGQQLLTNEEIVGNSMLAMIAGHDSTATLITFMVRHLADDPATLAAMVQEHEEIASNKADGEALTWEDLSKMKLTWRVAQETLRLVPPVFGNMRRAIEDIEFDGYRIPKGWQVFWAAGVTHMDPSIFHEPAKFDPSRFENQTSAAAPPCSFVAFGGGPRICPGMDFAKMETLVTMYYLVRRFKWKLCCQDKTFVWDPMPKPLHGLPIHLEQDPHLIPPSLKNKLPKEAGAMTPS